MNTGNGPHLSFPFRIGSNGRTAQVATLQEHIHDEIIQLLLTNHGERPFLPQFGGGVRRLVFETAGEAARGMAKAQITQAITTWLGHRVTLEDLSVTIENSAIDVEIKYRIAGAEDSRIMRFQRTGE